MRYEDRPMASVTTKLGVILVAIAVIGGAAYFLLKDNWKTTVEKPIPTPAPVEVVATETPPPAKPAYEEPTPVPVPEPLPDLNQSDAAVIAALKGLHINGLVEMILPQEIIRKFVRAIDLLEDGKVVAEYRPIASPQGAFVADSFHVKVSGGELGETQDVEQYRVSPKNYLRYTLFAQVISMLDSDAAVAVYKRFYPLLNKAYQELGLNKGNFHSVLIRAIDKMLSSPSANGDMILVRPKVYYEFADPVLEKQPDIYKLMLRMGPDNAEKIKTSLKNLRVKLLQK